MKLDFTLKKEDALTPALIESWAAMAEAIGAPREKVAGARQIAANIRQWQRDNFDDVKVPD